MHAEGVLCMKGFSIRPEDGQETTAGHVPDKQSNSKEGAPGEAGGAQCGTASRRGRRVISRAGL
jgi:hypothetical protein